MTEGITNTCINKFTEFPQIKLYEKTYGLSKLSTGYTLPDYGDFSTTPDGVGKVRGLYYLDDKKALRVGNNTEDVVDIGNNSFAMGESNTASGEASFAMGEYNKASGQASFAMGEYNKASHDYSMAVGKYNRTSKIYGVTFGNNTLNNQKNSISMGINIDNINAGQDNIGSIGIKTLNGTKIDSTDLSFTLQLDAIYYVELKGVAIRDNQSEKWVFTRNFIILVDSSGNVTISNDTNNDIVKDVTTWALDLGVVNDSANPLVKFQPTGEDSKNIYWNFTYNRNIISAGNYFVDSDSVSDSD